MSVRSPFVFSLCQVGAEGALKEELVACGLKPAFQRPGFVTSKAQRALGPEDVPRNLVFARTSALSLGPCAPAEVRARLEALGAKAVHAFGRERYAPARAPVDFERDRRAREVARTADLGGEEAGNLLHGALVADLVDVDDDALWLGCHRVRDPADRFAAGDPAVAVPEEAPSRAYKKLEEAALLLGVELRVGEHAVDIGASPGGVSFALLERGLRVTAIDPGELAPALRAHPRLTFLQRPVAEVDPRTLTRPVHWVALDLNISPYRALEQIAPIVRFHARSLRGLILTLKLGKWHMARRVPHFVAIVRELVPDLRTVLARQLPSNGVEVALIAR